MPEYRHDGKAVVPPPKITAGGTGVKVGQTLNKRPDTKNAAKQGKSSKRALWS